MSDSPATLAPGEVSTVTLAGGPLTTEKVATVETGMKPGATTLIRTVALGRVRVPAHKTGNCKKPARTVEVPVHDPLAPVQAGARTSTGPSMVAAKVPSADSTTLPNVSSSATTGPVALIPDIGTAWPTDTSPSTEAIRIPTACPATMSNGPDCTWNEVADKVTVIKSWTREATVRKGEEYVEDCAGIWKIMCEPSTTGAASPEISVP
mmetsp:Transcript_27580/g.72900  ORF Transcript_27580/g.72900 Transcript_27580/m.72900 type:complete len:208 (-) Transcript_27580:517-1140(-)